MSQPAAPLKVLMTADTIGGVWTYALELVKGLAEQHVAFSLATMGDPLTTAQENDTAGFANLAVHQSRFGLEWMPDRWADVDAAGDWLLALEQELKPDVVHLNGYSHGNLRWAAPTVMVAHSCVLSWWEAVKKEPAPPEWDTYRRRVAEGLRGASAVVAPTATMLASLTKHYWLPTSGTVIHNGRSAARLERPEEAKERLILAAGRLGDEAKNISTLGAATIGLPWRVAIAGRVADPSGQHEPPDHLVQLGFLAQEELADWLDRAAIYCLPARYEPFGLSILEAALARCALVLGDIPSLRELWADCAVFVRPDDPTRLREALLELIENPSRRSALGHAAHARGLEFTSTRMCEEYLSLYRKLLDRSANVGTSAGQ